MTGAGDRNYKSAVNSFRRAAFVVAAALLCACGGNVAAPPSASVTVAVTTNPAETTGSLVSSATTGPGGSDGRPGGSSVPVTTRAHGPAVDTIQVSKCYTNATTSGGGEMLIKGKSSDQTARLFAYRPDGSLIGELQNGGGNRYGGTVMPYQPYDPVEVTIKSDLGGSITVPTTPFQPDS